MIGGGGRSSRTFSSIASLVVPRKPSQVKVLDPRHPSLILLVVDLLAVLGPGLLLLLFRELSSVRCVGGLLDIGGGRLRLLLDVVGHSGPVRGGSLRWSLTIDVVCNSLSMIISVSVYM